MQTNCSIIQFLQTSSCFFLSINSLLHRKLANILTLCLLEAAPPLQLLWPFFISAMFYLCPTLSPTHHLPFPSRAMRECHMLSISSTITSLLFYDCVGLWCIQGLWIVTALVLPKTYFLTHSNISIFCLYCKNDVVLRDSLLECMC